MSSAGKTKLTGKKRPNRCPKCRASYFHLEVGLIKPVFVCTSGCGDRWSWGRDGGEYFSLATNNAGTKPSDWITFDLDDGRLGRAPLTEEPR